MMEEVKKEPLIILVGEEEKILEALLNNEKVVKVIEKEEMEE